MKIGIIVHSHTGNTYSVAQKLQEKLSAAGHEAIIERIQVAGGENPNVQDFRLENPPDASAYDALILAAPVRAFAISPVMAAYLKQLPALSGVKASAFVTMFFPFDWMGGRNALAKMGELGGAKGIKVADTAIVHWKSKQREKQIKSLADKLAAQFI